MPTFVLNRNYTWCTTRGHIINFIKGEPVHVPPYLAREAAALGAEPTDAEVDPLGEEETPEPVFSIEERAEKIQRAFSTIVEGNTREDFTANGKPTHAAMVRETGLKDIRKEEYDDLWTEFKSEHDV